MVGGVRVFPGRVPLWGNVAAGAPWRAGAVRTDVPGAQRHGDLGQLQCGAGPGLRVPARALAQPGGPLRARTPLRVLAPWASPPGETPQPLCATRPSSTQASLLSVGSSPYTRARSSAQLGHRPSAIPQGRSLGSIVPPPS